MGTSDSAIVVGAGIGGLTTALALERIGLPVTIVERRTVLEEAGAGIQLSPNASRVLFDLGLGAALTRRAVEPQRLAVRTLGSGRLLSSAPLGPAMRTRFGAPYLVIHRADLHTVLLDAARSRPGIRLLVGRAAVAAETHDDHALVKIETGTGQSETMAAPLIVGADGVWSKMRAATGDMRAPHYRGYAAWRTTIPVEAVPAGIDPRETGLWLGGGLHLVHYAVSGNRSVNIVAVVSAPSKVDGWAVEGDPAEIARRFAGATAPVRALIAAGAQAGWRIWSLHDLTAPERWTAGRLALLGDAAHPVLPFLAQGGALAIEDAAVLATEIAVSPDRIEAALQRYEAARRPRALRVQEAGRTNGRIYHLPRPFSFARDLVIRHLDGSGLIDRYDWLYGWQPEAAPTARAA